jgi:hypothetical protein
MAEEKEPTKIQVPVVAQVAKLFDKPDQFAEFMEDETPKETAFAKLNELFARLKAAEDEVELCEHRLKQAQKAFQQLNEFDVPAYMDELDIQEFTNTDGFKFEAKSTIRASIGKRKAQAHAWLINNGHGGLIKRTVSVAFNVDQGPDAEKLLKDLRKKDVGAGAKQDMKVEPQTLVSWVKKRLEAGDAVPADIFGIYAQRSVKITPPSE